MAELAGLRRELEQRRRDAAAAAAARARERRERELFADSVGPVTPLASSGRAEPRAARPAPVPVQRRRDEAAALRETLSDDFDVESLLETDAALFTAGPTVGPDVCANCAAAAG